MAKTNELPVFREKRKILFGEKIDDEERHRMGAQFMEAEHFDDALEFFARCDADGEVRNICEVAIERGDAPLYLRARVVLGEKPAEDDLVSLARRAEELERPTMAYLALLKAGHEEEAARFGEEVPHAEQEEQPQDEREGEGPQQ